MQLEFVNYYIFTSTIFKYCSSLSVHTALCPGSLGKMSSSKAISQALHTCSVSYFRWSHLCFTWNAVSFTKFLTPSVRFPQKTLIFHQSYLKTVFHCGLGALGSAFPDTPLHGGHLQDCAHGNVQAGHMWSPAMCLQGQWVMLVALSPSLVGLTSAQSDSSYLHLSFFLHY